MLMPVSRVSAVVVQIPETTDCGPYAKEECIMQCMGMIRAYPVWMQVLTPQQFRMVDDDNDIFNHSNRHFWEVWLSDSCQVPDLPGLQRTLCKDSIGPLRRSRPAHSSAECMQVMIPGMAAWGMVVCTGSNLLLRSAVVQAIGGFPGKTITEDYMLGLELAKHGWQSRYLQKYLALGAPRPSASAKGCFVRMIGQQWLGLEADEPCAAHPACKSGVQSLATTLAGGCPDCPVTLQECWLANW